MFNKKTVLQFVFLTFIISYLISGVLIFLSQYGYTVYNWVNTPQQFIMNIPFSLYILSPAIVSYIVLRKHHDVSSFWEWLKNVFYFRSSIYSYLFVILGIVLYFSIHMLVNGRIEFVLPFYTFFLSIPGNLIIGGLEEAGWMYILQPHLHKQYGYVRSSLYAGMIWILWHIPLFFIAGTNHGEGLINFWMFNIQLIAFRFFYGAIYNISGKGCVFMCILFHTLFNASSPLFGTMTMTWLGTILANVVLVFVSLITVKLHQTKQRTTSPL